MAAAMLLEAPLVVTVESSSAAKVKYPSEAVAGSPWVSRLVAVVDQTEHACAALEEVEMRGACS